jgi:hypothetical protein
MLRALVAIVGIFSTVALLAEGAVVAWLWTQGTLNPTTVREIRLALAGQTATDPDADIDPSQSAQTSQDEIREARVIRVLDLEARENELSLLKRLTSETANQLISDRRALDEMKEQFQTELERLRERTESEATEQTRTILLASPPEESVRRLMGLTATEGVELLRGLPEKSIARILIAFQADPQTVARGQEIFEGLYRGDPTRTAIQDVLDELLPETP